MMQMAEVKIFEFQVYPGKIEGDKAYVPNVLSSQDKFLNQLGVVEHELYTLLQGRRALEDQPTADRRAQRPGQVVPEGRRRTSK